MRNNWDINLCDSLSTTHLLWPVLGLNRRSRYLKIPAIQLDHSTVLHLTQDLGHGLVCITLRQMCGHHFGFVLHYPLSFSFYPNLINKCCSSLLKVIHFFNGILHLLFQMSGVLYLAHFLIYYPDLTIYITSTWRAIHSWHKHSIIISIHVKDYQLRVGGNMTASVITASAPLIIDFRLWQKYRREKRHTLNSRPALQRLTVRV